MDTISTLLRSRRAILDEVTGSHREGIGLLPGDGLSPGAQPHLVRERLGDDEEDEGDVGHGDDGGQQHHQAVTVARRQVGPDGRARHQARRERRRHLRREREMGREKERHG